MIINTEIKKKKKKDSRKTGWGEGVRGWVKVVSIKESSMVGTADQ